MSTTEFSHIMAVLGTSLNDYATQEEDNDDSSAEECQFQSFIGKGGDKAGMTEYLDRLNTAYEVLSYVHGAFLAIIVLFCIVTILRRHKLDSFQWIQLAELIFLNSVQVAFMIKFNKEMVNHNCGETAKLFGASIYCGYIAISLSNSWQFQSFFKQLLKYAQHGFLPNEKILLRKKILMVVVWLVVFLDYVIYIGLLKYYTALDMF